VITESAKVAVEWLPGNCAFLSDGSVLALGRKIGDSRYPYGPGGFNFWAYSSGRMHCNDGLFDIFPKVQDGAEPVIAFFAGIEVAGGGWMPLPLLPVPELQTGGLRVSRYTIMHPAGVFYCTEAGGMRFVLRVFVDTAGRLGFSCWAVNCSSERRRYFVSSFFNPHLRHALHQSEEDRWFREVEKFPLEGDGAGIFLITTNEDVARGVSLTNRCYVVRKVTPGRGTELIGVDETTARDGVVGSWCGSLFNPASVYEGRFLNVRGLTAFTQEGVAADMVHAMGISGGELRIDWVLDFAEGISEGENGDPGPPECSAGRVDAAFWAVDETSSDRHAGLRFRFMEEEGLVRAAVLNRFVEHLKRQVEFCALINGYVQLSENSLIGVRDIFQALEALAFWQPAVARGKMLEGMEYMTPEGRFFRQYSLPAEDGRPGRMDLRPFIDQGCWVIAAVASYLQLTGDVDFLRRRCGYHEIVDERSGVVRRSEKEDEILMHLVRTLDYLLAMRDTRTGCVRVLYGDWNDALDGMGVSRDPHEEYGSGVSVMATLQVYENTRQMCEILERFGNADMRGRIRKYRRAAAELREALYREAIVEAGGERRILHGWGDGRSYEVGGFEDPDGVARDGLTANAFWVLSGMLERDASLRGDILKAFERLDSKYGLRTFQPAFPAGAPGVGRISRLPAGTAENGAVYVHAAAFGIAALFAMGEPRRAWKQLAKIFPFTSLHERLTHSPFVMPNSYGFNRDKGIDGESMNDWQTGSSNAVLKILIRFVMGIQPGWDGLLIRPAAWSPFREMSCRLVLRGRRLEVRVVRGGKDGAGRSFLVDGKRRSGATDGISGVEGLFIGWEELSSEETLVEVIG